MDCFSKTNRWTSTATRLRPSAQGWLGYPVNPVVIYHPTATRLRQSRRSRRNEMPQSLSAVYIHLVFSTKNRQPFLRDKVIRTRLHAQLGGISKTLGCAPILTGGDEDHVHLLARFVRSIT